MGIATLLSRRAVLKGLPAVAVVPGAMVATTAYAGPNESPEFIRAVHALGSALIDYDRAADAKAAAIQRFARLAPAIPAEIRGRDWFSTEQGFVSRHYVCERATDLEGNPLFVGNRHAYLADAHQLGMLAALVDKRTTHGKECHRLLAAARRYENAREAARDASKFGPANEAHYRAEAGLRRTAQDLATAAARTPQGARLKVDGWLAAASRCTDVRQSIYQMNKVLENVAEVLGAQS